MKKIITIIVFMLVSFQVFGRINIDGNRKTRIITYDEVKMMSPQEIQDIIEARNAHTLDVKLVTESETKYNPSGFCFRPYFTGLELSVGTTVTRGGTLWDINCCGLCGTMGFLPSKKKPGWTDDYFNFGWNFTFFEANRLRFAFRPMVGIGFEETGKYYCATGMHSGADLSECVCVYYAAPLPVFHFGICLKVGWALTQSDSIFNLHLVGTLGVSNNEGVYFAIGLGF